MVLAAVRFLMSYQTKGVASIAELGHLGFSGEWSFALCIEAYTNRLREQPKARNRLKTIT